MSNRKRREETLATLELLAERFPACFTVLEARRQPLAIGIHVRILAELNDAISRRELWRALRRYTSAPPYLHKLVEGTPRVDLDGQPAGCVTKSEQDDAAAKLKVLAARRAQRKAATSTAAPKKAPPAAAATSPALRRGDGLAQLREAARRRREREESATT